MKNDEILDSLHEGFDPKIAIEDSIKDYIKLAVNKILASDKNQNFESFLN